MSGIYWWHLFHKDMKSCFSTTQFRIWQFQTNAQTLCFHRHLLAQQSTFWGQTSGFSDRWGSQDISKSNDFGCFWTCCQLSFGLHIYDSTWIKATSIQRREQRSDMLINLSFSLFLPVISFCVSTDICIYLILCLSPIQTRTWPQQRGL
jgi:hypothetical protein